MKKRSLRSFFITLLVLMLAFGWPALSILLCGESGSGAVCVSALTAAPKEYVIDEAGLLTAEQKTQLENKLAESRERLGFDIVIVTTTDTGGLTTSDYADKVFEDGGYGNGPNRDGTLLLVDTSKMEWATSTTGYGITALTDYGLDQIESEVLDLMADAKWYKSFDTFATRVDEYVTSAKNGNIIDYVEPEPVKKSFPWAISGSISAVLGALVGGISTGSAKSQLKTVYAQTQAKNYAVRNSLELDRSTSRDLYLYSNVTRVPIAQVQGPRDDGGSHYHGGSTTHVSSGGMTHGGHSGKIGKR